MKAGDESADFDVSCPSCQAIFETRVLIENEQPIIDCIVVAAQRCILELEIECPRHGGWNQ